MSPAEIAWRVRGKVQQAADRRLLDRRQRRLPRGQFTTWTPGGWPGRTEAVDPGWPMPGEAGSANGCEAWRGALILGAERILSHRLDLFDLEGVAVGDPIDWNREFKAGKAAPRGFAGGIDYRDHSLTGDCKFVWEPSRHQHLVTLGRAYRLTGDVRYAGEVVAQIRSWIDQCPFGTGMNWRSPLELGIRLINWVWALELIRPAEVISAEDMELILGSVQQHCREISGKYSRYSSANNHVIGEAAGVFIASSYFHGLHRAATWRERSRRLLMEEIGRQTHADGGNVEQALGYHLFVLEFLTLAGVVAKRCGEDFPRAYWQTLDRMYQFLLGFVEGGEHAPMFGDADDGYVIQLCDRKASMRDWLGVGGRLLDDSAMNAEAGERLETAWWLLGGEDPVRAGRSATFRDPLGARAFPQTGCYLLQGGHRGEEDRVSVSFDCGELGFGAIAAHGHADALSITLRAFGEDILVDPGTYDYFTYPSYRRYFRSTAAHNTIEVDGEDQSEMLGPFLWGRRAKARCLTWEPSEDGGVVAGEHDGYAHLGGGVTHHRRIELSVARGELVVRDELNGTGAHRVAQHWHFGEGVGLELRDGTTCVATSKRGTVLFSFEPGLDLQVLKGSEHPVSGWFSPGYHRKSQVWTLSASAHFQGRLRLTTRILLEKQPPGRTSRRAAAEMAEGAMPG